MEELTARLISYSRQAQLPNFAEKVKNIVIAARENKTDDAEKYAHSLRQSLEQMERATGAALLEENSRSTVCCPLTARN
ncbi:MAG: hypothetical protein PHQ00_03465 [Phycisphaerae bacterium]|nr:hypothetical protein [Phycisphaerae bacterium]